MWLNRLFRGRHKPEPEGPQEPTVNQGIFYLYLIMGLQLAFVFILAAVIMFVGKVLATPMWVFLFAFGLVVAGCMYVWRKARQQFHKLRESFKRADLSDRNYEISVMGGFLTMRVEQNPRKLLEAPPPSTNILDAETVHHQAPR